MIGRVTEERIRVRYAETDQMGHAYYANYLVWFEQARTAYFRDRGLPYRDLEATGFKLPVVEVWARYKAEVKYDDEIIVKVWVEEMKRTALKVVYEVVLAETGKIATEGYTWHVLVNAEFRPVALPDFLKEVAAQE